MSTASETMSMAMSTGTQGMAMPMSTSGMGGMSPHDMGGMMSMGGMMMPMSQMMMVFFTSFQTPLYTTAWTPTSKGEYAGTCIFLIVLACALRFMLALRPILEARFWRNGNLCHPDGDRLHDEPDESKAPGRRLQTVRHDIAGQWKGWRVSAAAARATFEVLVAGVGYLLMLAVMTMNVGYLLSVLGGVWLGTFLLGGLACGR